MKLKKVNNLLQSIIYRNPNIIYTCNPFKIYEFNELLRGINFTRNDIILDIGCGDGLETILLGRKCKKIYGIDISKKKIELAIRKSKYIEKRINTEFKTTNLDNAKFYSNYFDKIFSVCVLEHISNYNEVLKECYRVLKNNGQLIFSVDSLENIKDENFKKFHKKQYKVTQYFAKEELTQILSDIGYKKILIYPILISKFAKRLFIKTYKKYTKIYCFFISIFKYICLKFAEKRYSDSKNGIFLIIKCVK